MGYDPARSGRSSKPREPARVPRTRAAPPRPVRRFVGRAAPTRRGRLWLEARHAPPSHARRPQGTARGSARARSGNRGSPCSRFRVRSRRRVSDDPPRHPVPRVLGKGATTGGPGIDRDHPHHGDAFFRRGGVAEVAGGLLAQAKRLHRPGRAGSASRVGCSVPHLTQLYRDARAAEPWTIATSGDLTS